jgi:hypothetical protein
MPPIAGVAEYELAVAVDMPVVMDFGRRLREQPFEPRLAGVQGLGSNVFAVESSRSDAYSRARPSCVARGRATPPECGCRAR